MTETSKATEQVQAPGSLVLASWLASRAGGAQRAGLVPAISNDVSPVLSSDPRILELFGSNLAASGVAVTATSAQRVAAVYGCVTRIAGGISTMPINIYERIWDEKAQRYARRQVDNKDLWWMLNERPTAVGNALAMDQYTGKFFGAGAHHNMVLETDKKMDPDKVTALQRMFSEKYSGLDNAHNKPLVLTEGMTAKPVTISAQDAQLIDARRYTKLDICTAFGVPPHMIGETSAATTWGSGLEQIGRAFVTYTLAPHLKRIEDELNFKLFRTARFFCEFDRNALQAGDSKAQSDEDKASLGGPGAGPGWVSVNEVRRRRNLPPLTGEKYDTPFWPEAAKAANSGAPAP
jgi:phage portal protein BeeE